MSITYNGTLSDDLGVIVERFPNPQIAPRRVSVEVVPGRNGVLLQDDGSFASTSATYEMHISAVGGKLFTKAIRKIAAWLLAAPGFHRLEDTYEPDVFRLARYNGGVDVTSYFRDHGRFQASFECQPQRYLKMGDIEIEMKTPYNSEGISGPGKIGMPIPYGAVSLYALAPDAPANSFVVIYRDAEGQTVGDPLDTDQGTPTPVPAGAASINCIWNNTAISAVVGMVDSDGEQVPLCGVSGVNPILFNPTAFEARPLLRFIDTSEEPSPVHQTIVQNARTGIGADGSIAPASRLNYTSDAIGVSGFAYAIVTGLGYSFFDSNGSSVGFYANSSEYPPLVEQKIIIPASASTIVVGGSETHEAALALQAPRPNPGTKAVTINGIDISLDFTVHDTIILDCDLHDAYYLDGSSANDKVSFSSNLIAYPTFPGFVPGENTVFVRDAAHLDFAVIPRWWTL